MTLCLAVVAQQLHTLVTVNQDNKQYTRGLPENVQEMTKASDMEFHIHYGTLGPLHIHKHLLTVIQTHQSSLWHQIEIYTHSGQQFLTF